MPRAWACSLANILQASTDFRSSVRRSKPYSKNQQPSQRKLQAVLGGTQKSERSC